MNRLEMSMAREALAVRSSISVALNAGMSTVEASSTDIDTVNLLPVSIETTNYGIEQGIFRIVHLAYRAEHGVSICKHFRIATLALPLGLHVWHQH
jgi:hypothetical protein